MIEIIKKKVIIIPVSFCYPFYQDSASERFWCDWLLKPLNADKYNGTQNLEDYDLIIYQKAHNNAAVRFSKQYRHKVQVFVETDPEFLFPEGRNLKEIMANMDFIIASSEGLAEGMKQFGKPVYMLSEGHDLNFYKIKKVHEDRKPIMVWYGYSENFERIKPLLPIIDAYKLELITICDKPVGAGKFVKWDLNTFNQEVIKGDVVLNLPDNDGLKSNNKTISAWLMGMPVVERTSDIFRFMKYNERIKEGKEKLKYAEKEFDIIKVAQYIIKTAKKYENLKS